MFNKVMEITEVKLTVSFIKSVINTNDNAIEIFTQIKNVAVRSRMYPDLTPHQGHYRHPQKPHRDPRGDYRDRRDVQREPRSDPIGPMASSKHVYMEHLIP